MEHTIYLKPISYRLFLPGYQFSGSSKENFYDIIGDLKIDWSESSVEGIFFGDMKNYLEIPILPLSSTALIKEYKDKETQYLTIENLNKEIALIPAGTIFLGGSQNRTLVSSHLLGRGKYKIKVFCIEQGRWTKRAKALRQVSLVPPLIEYQLIRDRVFGMNNGDMQTNLWDDILSSHEMNGEVPATMYLFGKVDDTTEYSVLEKNIGRAFFETQPHIGLSNLRLYPNVQIAESIYKEMLLGRIWTNKLINRGNFQFAYFRIFDQIRKVAIRCNSRGVSFKDMNRNPILFNYEDIDLTESLKYSFVLPEYEIPKVGEKEGIYKPEEYLSLLSECRMKLDEENGFIRRWLFGHPTLSLFGEALTYKGSLVYLNSIALRPYLNSITV